MTDHQLTGPIPCKGEPCQLFLPGHNMHHIHARRLSESPWGWRDAVVVSVIGEMVRVEYLNGSAVTLWHHRSLAEAAEEGMPVRLHEQYYALGMPSGWYNVVIASGGLGSVPLPSSPESWRGQWSAGITDAVSGLGLPTDHISDDHQQSM